MSNRFHNKWHRASHHSYKDPTIIDAGWDPIASPDNPFQGDFVLADGSGGTQIGELYSKIIHTTKLTTESPEGQDWNADKILVDTNLEVTGNITGDVDLYVKRNTSGHGWLKIDSYGDFGGYLHSVGNISGDSQLFITGDGTFGGNVNITGNETVKGNFNLTGNANINGSISGHSWLKIDQYGHFVGDVSGDSNLYVTGYGHIGEYVHIYGNDGTADAYGLIVDNNSHFVEDVRIDQNLYVTGNNMSAFIKNAHIDYADITSADIIKIDIHVGEKDGYILSGGLTGDEKTNIPESYTAGSHNLYLSGEGLISDSYAILGGKVNISGETHINDKLTIQRYGADIHGATVLFNSLSVSGKSHFKEEAEFLDDVNVSGNLNVEGTVNVTGDSTFVNTYTTGTSTVSTLNVTGDSDLDGNLDVGGTLTVTGATTLNSTLNVSGETALKNTSIGGTLGVTGAVDFDSTLNVDGATTLNGGVTVKTSSSNKSTVFDGEKIYRKNGTQSAGTFLFPSYGGTLVARPNSPLPPSGNIPMFDEYGNIVDSGNDATDFYPMVEKTWEQLKAMRDDGTLVPGQRYRITDYVATTVQEDTQSANHPFDIIVRADSANKLNENAYAIKNAEDTTYFVNSKLEAWQVWYCLDNDTNRFAWADDSVNGKGVVYRLIDEFNNDCPYDFKGITMKAYGDTDNVYRYTFDSGDVSNNTDYSLSGYARNVDNNVIGRYLASNKHQLNQIIFKGGICHSNTFGDSCYSNTFGAECNSNTFGVVCHNNTFGYHCYSNTFGNSCSRNTFGDSCGFNTFGNGCQSNTLGDYCDSNTFGNSCNSNTLGGGCNSNTFGYSCAYNTFGNIVSFGAFMPKTSRAAGAHVVYSGSMYKVDVRYRGSFSASTSYSVNDGLYYDGKYYKCTTSHRGAWDASHFQEVQLVGYILVDDGSVLQSHFQNIIFENGVQYVALYCRASRSDWEYYQNVTVTSGIKGTSSENKLIPDDNKDQAFKTTYRPANSQVISV